MKLITRINQLQDKQKFIENVLEFGAVKVLQLQIKANEVIPEHDAPEDVLVIVQTGRILFDIEGEKVELTQDNFLYLAPKEKHKLQALQDSTALVIKTRCQAP